MRCRRSRFACQPPKVERLEPRLLLSGSPLISEFMADNTSTLADGDGRYEDWIELHNPAPGALDLEGWYLSDDPANRTKWQFPDVTLAGGQHMLLFASGEDVEHYIDAGGYLHTTFRLDADGGSLLLTEPDGETIAHAHLHYTDQLPDVSYGVTNFTARQQLLIEAGDALSFHVPTSGDDPGAWTQPDFTDPTWADSYRAGGAGLLITEIGTGETKAVEIENVFDAALDTTGWVVLINDASVNIDAVNPTAWYLPASVAPGEVLCRTGNAGDNYWGAAIDWAAEGAGWAAIVDDAGTVRDVAAWGYAAAELASLTVAYGPWPAIDVGAAWFGDGAAAGTIGSVQVPGFVAYNDHIPGSGTHGNATTYTTHASSPNSGLMKNVDTGEYTGVTATVTSSGHRFANLQGEPQPGTDAHALFGGYVTFGSASSASIEVDNEDHYTYTFTGLDDGDAVTYDFAGSAVRGDSRYTDRWTLVTLLGAVSATSAHSTGEGVVVLGDRQVAVWTGQNHDVAQGYVARWSCIDPGPDGEFSVASEQYTDSIPTSVRPDGMANGSKGYGLTGIRLEETGPSGPLSWLRRTGGTDADGAGDFVRDANGTLGAENDDLDVPFGTVVPATTGVGFSDDQLAFDALLATDVSTDMAGAASSLWTRIEFDDPTIAGPTGMTLRMKYDDGFVAYLNGVQIAERNAPASPAWDSTATATRDNAAAVGFEDIDVTAYLDALLPSGNVLAIHVLNVSAGDADLLMLPELVLEGVSYDPGGKFFTAPTPGAFNGAGDEYPGVLINEFHTDPDVKTELTEFVELYNGSSNSVDVAGWQFTDGIEYTIPAGTTIPPKGYLVIAKNPDAFESKFGFTPLGPWTGSLDNDGETIELTDATFETVDRVDYGLAFPWPITGEDPGPSVQLVHPSLSNDLGGSWRGAMPTPGGVNAVFAVNAAPQMRQVDHLPNQPVSGQDVTITAKVTDPDGVASVVLHYQLVEPGAYIEYGTPDYENTWTDLAMVDDGSGCDEQADDSVYSAVIPGALNTHRLLVRYRITATDASNDALSLRAPYADDMAGNFAYYVYDGVPSWTGAIDPDSTDPELSTPVTYDAATLTSVPVYQLITTRADHEDSQYIPNSTASAYGGSAYLWQGTLIYDGVVYDNIRYRPRGGVHRFRMGKNMWKFDFNRGHYFQARDDYGKKYDTKWDKLNFSAAIQQGNYQHRGEQGVFEAATFLMFNLAGVPAPNTNWVHFRIVESAHENGSTQYDGDFQGLYLVIEQMDGAFLDEHGLPDGNLYKVEGYNGSLNNQGPTAPSDKSDYNLFKNGSGGETGWANAPSEQWWRDNVDLDMYYAYRAVCEGAHHGDIGYGKNYFFYSNPETGIWSMLPWDVDLTWANNMYGNGEDPFRNGSYGRILLDNPNLDLEYRNALREFYDLLYNPEQMNRLLDGLGAVIDDSLGGPSIVDADRAMWDYNPIMTNYDYVSSSKAGEGRFYQKAATKDFPGMVQIMKDYVVSSNREFETNTDDPDLPRTPTLAYRGPAGFPVNGLAFEASPFDDATGSFAAMEWRIAEVTDESAPAYDPDDPGMYEITTLWESGELLVYDKEMTVPATVARPGHAYRVRVRYKDSTGRWSHWSGPVHFVAGEGTATPLTEGLRVTEVMYHPPPDPAAVHDDEEFEFIELTNVGGTVLDLSGVSVTRGVTFAFAPTAVTSLAPGERVVIVRNQTAFASRYDTAEITVAGQWIGGLSNGDERIELADATDGVIQSFRYRDGWQSHTDGEGFSLVVIDEAAPAEAWEDGDNWMASPAWGGDPGEAGGGLEPGTVIITEVLAHTDEPTGDWIELHNTSEEIVEIGGWFLSDSGSVLTKYRIADGTAVAPGAYLVLTESSNFGPGSSDPGSALPFALSELGDDVYLSSSVDGAPGGYREHVDFDVSPNGTAFGLHTVHSGETEFTLMAATTPGADNADAGPYIGPVVLNEVLYHPTGPLVEFVELYNRTPSPVSLYDPANPGNTWRVGGVDLTVPEGLVLPAWGYAVLTSAAPAAFRALYGSDLPADVPVIQWDVHAALDNDGESLRLERPDTPEPLGGVPYIIEDRVVYDDDSPWPVAADGDGSSVMRTVAGAYGNDVYNWADGGYAGSPGRPNSAAPQVADVGTNDNSGIRDELTSVAVRFTEDVSDSLDAADLALHNETTGEDVDLSLVTVVYDSLTNTARWDLSATMISLGELAFTVSGDGLQTPAGVPLGGDGTDVGHATVLTVPGDATLDGQVSKADLDALRSGFGQAGADWTSGDFDGSGRVDRADYVILKRNHGACWLVPPSAPAPPAEEPTEAPSAGSALANAPVLQCESGVSHAWAGPVESRGSVPQPATYDLVAEPLGVDITFDVSHSLATACAPTLVAVNAWPSASTARPANSAASSPSQTPARPELSDLLVSRLLCPHDLRVVRRDLEPPRKARK